ncbi:uncharacterized protein EDB91DRAFT_1170321 [Suillus paluster]|uniref:uncharacterized protein n=1 Tax=Suillus paluster TaxID=48578 RepID=UPI001B872A70|nr:uncharacterized protein EDB91DRAFT_1170321 [Suillus paluster]KAG1724709.1 hypothetical protein EDB91DRAFT_1170321 [Suillus paluster]
MSSPSSSCSPSSSAVTIPIPGKSILKRPPPAQTGILSRIKGFLPAQSPASASDDVKPLKRAHFILPKLAIVYPISSLNPPSTPTLKDEKRAIEEREAERRRRVVRGNSIGPNETEDWWNLEKVESFYRECCASREEEPDPAISAAFKRASNTNPRSVDLSGVQLTPTSAAILSDVFTIEWGLRKLTLRECDLDEYKLKLMLHALLIPSTLVFLSVASNRRLKTPAFKVLGFYASKAKSLQFLDLSQTSLDKKAVEYIVASLATAPEPGLISLRLDDCSLRVAALDVLARVIRYSSLRNLSLRHNRINATGAVALALMIRDYPDVVPTTPNSATFPLQPGSVISSPPSSPIPPNVHLPPPSPVARTGPVLPPPRHPSSMPPQTTYTPYVPRTRRGVAAAQPPPLSASGQVVPIITSNPQGGVTTRHLTPNFGPQRSEGSLHPNGASHKHDDGPSAALLDKVRALDALPRLGALRTLDLRGNDLRNGVTYLAQVLKRNRTLKVLNLSENKLDVPCLVSIAEALKYNLCLETLDLSRNPCSGPGLEGIQSLRTAFTLNTALKRLFLSSTNMTSQGAIALAEFLPESNSLLHLDLTVNNLDIAAVMALSSGLKANHTMRCLDLMIPPDDEEFAKMCREILNTCIRNTEEAEKAAHVSDGIRSQTSNRGLGKGVWNMIQESELAKSIRQGGGLKSAETVSRAHALLSQIESSVNSPTSTSVISSGTSSPTVVPPADQDLVQQAKTIVDEITDKIQTTTDVVLLEELLSLCDKLNSAIAQLSSSPSSRSLLHGLGLTISSEAVSSTVGDALHESPTHVSEDEEPLTPKVDKGKGRAEPEPEEPEKVLSPTFMITESEDEDEDDSRYLGEEDQISVPSPVVRSKSWVEEEGEIFRKGAVLLGPEEMEGEYAGEELRRELLEAMVERPPPRGIIDEFGMDLDVSAPEAASPPTEEPLRPSPRPYISRIRSTSSNGSTGDLHSPISPINSISAARSPTSPTSRPFPGSFSASSPTESR